MTFFCSHFRGKSPRLGAAIIIVQPEQRRADFLKLCDAVTVKPLVTRYTTHKGAVALANIFLLGGSPALCPNGIEIGHVFDAILYKRSSFPGIPFGMPYFRLFCFQLSKSMPFLMEKDNFPFFRSESCDEAY